MPVVCRNCRNSNPAGSNFCNRCGAGLVGREVLRGDSAGASDATGEDRSASPVYEERKHVTALFSDISGYTFMSERLELEDVRDITKRVFDEILAVISEFGGFVEKHIGDAVVALFGIPKAHEDDPVRAVRAARKIHRCIRNVSPGFQEKVGYPLSMHTGICTGPMISGEVEPEKGIHGATGSTISLASRLSDIGKAGEILVDWNTFCSTEGFFTFQKRAPSRIEGWDKPVQAFRVVAEKKQPRKVHRLSGMRAALIGRHEELNRLQAAAERLGEGAGSVIAISGDAGTGKSRLVEEFKSKLDAGIFQWLEMTAYPYAQNTPYFPLIDFLNRTFRIEDTDPLEQIEDKIQTGIGQLTGMTEGIGHHVRRLYTSKPDQNRKISPESWKRQLHEYCTRFLSALAAKRPTVFCLEDLHWADPSFLDMVRRIIPATRLPILFLCLYRPEFTLFGDDSIGEMNQEVEPVLLTNLDVAQAEAMMESLLETAEIPETLRRFVPEQTEGNPFYLEEVINSLVESNMLVRKGRQWQLLKPIDALELPPTINGVISARIDRLDTDTKRTLREASVIGRTFLLEILKRISDKEKHIVNRLETLVQLDLIKAKSNHPEASYVFKHALTQQVACNGLLTSQRCELHERIARVIEDLFQDTLSNYFETLAYHYELGENRDKAVCYLIKSGEKSLNKYAVEEAHRYFQKAFDLLSDIPDKSDILKQRLVDLIIQWSFVYHYRGDFFGLRQLLTRHEAMAEEAGDRQNLGMFYTQLGFVFYQTGEVRTAYEYLRNAFIIGKQIDDPRIEGHACAILSWCAPDLGLLEDALRYGRRGVEIYRRYRTDDFIYFNTMGGLGLTYWFTGDRHKAIETGESLLDWSRENDNVRGRVLGHFVIGCGHFTGGEFDRAAERFQRAIRASADPWFSQFPAMMLCFVWITVGEFAKAEATIGDVLDFCERFGTNHIRTLSLSILGIVLISRGCLKEGFKMVEDAQKEHLEKGRKFAFAIEEHILGRLFHEVRKGTGARPSILKNIGFLLTRYPMAHRIAEGHFKKAIDTAEQIGARALAGQAYLDLGYLYRDRGQREEAGKAISKAIERFEQCGIERFLTEAKTAIAELHPT